MKPHTAARIRSARFPLLSSFPPARSSDPLASQRLAVASGFAFLRALERRARASLRERPGSFGPVSEALFDLVAESDLLPVVAPHGRVGAGFATRCLAAARERRRSLLIEREALRIAAHIALPPRAKRAGLFRHLATPTVRRLARLARLATRYTGEPEEGLRPGELAIPGTPLLVDQMGRISSRPTIPGSGIVVGPRLISGKSGLRISAREAAEAPPPPTCRPFLVFPGGSYSPETHRARRRLGGALAIVEAAWPEAAAEIRARTRLVLPLSEPGLVSFSLGARPGVTFVNLRGKTLLDLADDLLHETAHHRLHAIENGSRLFARARRPAPSVREEIRYWSPWRRAMRPVRGILHSCYTFAFRAELLERIVAAASGGGGRVGPLRPGARSQKRLLAQATREKRWIARSIVDLQDAAERGLLTPPGRRLARRIEIAARGT